MIHLSVFDQCLLMVIHIGFILAVTGWPALLGLRSVVTHVPTATSPLLSCHDRYCYVTKRVIVTSLLLGILGISPYTFNEQAFSTCIISLILWVSKVLKRV